MGAAVAAMLAALVAASAWFGLARDGQGGDLRDPPADAAALMLFSSLPIYWGEAADIGALLDPAAKRHWARTTIEAIRPLRPVDTLDEPVLRGRRDLLMVQPRPLSPAENVALDAWVARGGRLLLFADPALTDESEFMIGDKRRPQDVVLLSPILARWGLRLEFDEDQPLREQTVVLGDRVALPINLPGRFVAQPAGRADARCDLEHGGLIAACSIGKGRVLAIADAALFEEPGDAASLAAREAGLRAQLARAFEP